MPARMLAGATLAVVIALLATSAVGKRYRLAARTGAAGFLGVIALDASLIASVALAGVPLTWVLAVAMAASAARLCYAARAVRPALAG
jgi:hypothetical protein